MKEFFDKLPLTERWLVQYEYDAGWKSFIINRDVMEDVLQQIRSESPVQIQEFENIGDSSGAAFSCHVRSIRRLRFLDITAYKDLRIEAAKRPRKQPVKAASGLTDNQEKLLAFIRSNGIDMADVSDLVAKAQASKTSTYTSREGGFFKFTCSFPLNLKRYQIFNQIDKEAAMILQKESCIIWAFKNSGMLSGEELDTARNILRTRVFPITKLKEIAEILNMQLIIRYFRPKDNKTQIYRYGSNQERQLKLVLFEGHYFLDEDLPVSLLAIRNYNAIKEYRVAKKWKFEDQMRTIRYVAKKDAYEKSTKVSTNIMKIIQELNDCGYFIPIHYGDFGTYSTTLYKEDLAPLETLNYNEKYCTKLKEPRYVKKDEPEENEMRPQGKKGDNILFCLKKVVYANFECSTDGVH